MAAARRLALAFVLAGACGGGGDSPGGDAATTDAPPSDGRTTDARTVDARAVDARLIDASSCTPLQLTSEQACAVALTGTVTACAVDPGTGAPSQNGWLAVHRPDGALGYMCADQYTADGGYYFDGDRAHLRDTPDGCCGGAAGALLPWPVADPLYGVPHGPTHIKPWETATLAGGDLHENPFTIIVSSPASAATFNAQRAQWQAWANDHQPHPGPDGTGAYWFEFGVSINWVLVPTMDGTPLILIAPEVSSDAAYTTPLGHPTDGVCGSGGSPMAFIGGEVRGATLTNHSGRFGLEAGVTINDLRNAAALFNCYGIEITNTLFTPP